MSPEIDAMAIEAGAVADLEELLELARLAMETVEVPDDDGIGRPSRIVGEHSPVLGSGLAE